MLLQSLCKFQLKLLLNRTAGPKCLIGFDIGSESTGISISSPDLKEAYLLEVLQHSINSPGFYRRLKSIVEGHQPKALIVGKTNIEVNIIISYIKQEADRRNLQVITKLGKVLTKPMNYTWVSEAFTTKESRNILNNLHKLLEKQGTIQNEKGLQDGLSAVLILERYLMYYNNQIKSEQL